MSIVSIMEESNEISGKKAVPVSAERAHPPRRILLVDDDAELRKLYANFLMIAGYEVDTAGDGEAGWEALYAESFTPDGYDLLITDNNMPRLSGVGLIKKVRAAGLNVPIILASGNAPDDTQSLRLAAVLPKPFTGPDLLQAIEKALHLHTGHNKKSQPNH
jgi:DNA-binding response OmpR family regulator